MPEVTAQHLDDAQILWEYHQLHHELRPTDVAIGLGSHDLGVAFHAADLYQQGWFPLIVFTGANAPTTIERFPDGEAVHYAREAIARGVPADRIRVEPKATNTGENITLAHELLAAEGIHPRSATLITRPYQQRRAYATARKLWPELDIIASAQPLDFHTYLAEIGDQAKVLNMLVGDTQRIWVYAERGFAIPQAVPTDVRGAYERLMSAGFTSRRI
jgi:uncharacterized SAM-binding protein YcdF (DUF218 family)